MTVNELIKPFQEKYEKCLDLNFEEIAVNCISLCETWLTMAKSKTLMFRELDDNGNIVKSLYGVTPDNLTTELFSICINKPKNVHTIEVYYFTKNNGVLVDNFLGAMDIN